MQMGIKLAKSLFAIDLNSILERSIFNDESNYEITEIAQYVEDVQDSLTFYINDKLIKASHHSGIVLSDCEILSCKHKIESSNPKLEFVKILNFLINNDYIKNQKEINIQDTCRVSESAILEEGIQIGENTIIGDNVVIKSGTTIGKNCTISSGTIIGANGFGFVKNEIGEYIRFPHLGSVVIEDNVDIGSLSMIDKAPLSGTTIKKGVKIDSNVHIGHGCYVGEHTIITSSSTICGSVEIGSNCYIGARSVLSDNISVGDHSFICIGSNITKNVGENLMVGGNPFQIIKKIN